MSDNSNKLLSSNEKSHNTSEEGNLDNNNKKTKNGRNMFNIDPYTAQMLILRSELYIVQNYPNLVSISISEKLSNDKLLDYINKKTSVFIIKGFTEEDIHKAIKYNLWSSTNFGNNKLNNEYKKNPVLLLFSTYKSDQFIGLAEMKSEVDFKKSFPLWARDDWKGLFNIEWLSIKDVPFREFRNVPCAKREKKENGEYNFINYSVKSLSNSPDCQLIPQEESGDILKVFYDHMSKNSILEHFEFYDRRQANYENFISQNIDYKTYNNRKQNYNTYNNNNSKINSNVEKLYDESILMNKVEEAIN